MRNLFVVLALLGLAVPTFANELTPAAIRAMLQFRNATAVVQALDAGDAADNRWSALVGHIEGGEQAWLDLVPLLAPGTDAGTAEDLRIALSRALTANAPGVLALMSGARFAPEDICTSNEIEVPVMQAVAFIDKALVAVAAILDPELRAARNACLGVLGQTRPAILVTAAHAGAD